MKHPTPLEERTEMAHHLVEHYGSLSSASRDTGIPLSTLYSWLHPATVREAQKRYQRSPKGKIAGIRGRHKVQDRRWSRVRGTPEDVRQWLDDYV